MAEQYQSVVIGSGPGGYVAALRLAATQDRVAIVEARDLGGTCLNRGCIPAKTLLHSSQMAAEIAHADHHGIEVRDWRVDLSKLMKRKASVVKRLNGGVKMLLKSRKVTIIEGTGQLVDKNTVKVALNDGGETELKAESIIVATGSEPAVPGFLPDDRSKVLTSDEILDLQQLPESILILGGGYIGCEFATVFSELGSKVIVVEMLDRLLPMGDKQVSELLAKTLKQQGVALHLGVMVEKMDVNGDNVVTTLKDGNQFTTTLAGVCAGRRPLSAGIGLEGIGIELTKQGFIPVDDHCRTSVPGVYAIGDVTGVMQLAHVASRQADVAANNILGQDDSDDFSIVPSAVYTHPEIGQVGLTLEQAKEQGLQAREVTFSMMASGMAMAYNATSGFIKLVVDTEHDAPVGAHLVCPHASDIVQEVAVMMKAECTVHEIAETIHGHPSFCEGVKEAAEIAIGRPLHGH